MSKQTAWLELFTGVVIDDPDTKARQEKLSTKVADAATAQETYLRKKQQQAAALSIARDEFNTIKVDTQKVLSAKIDSGPFKGKSFLDVKNGQISEIDIEDVSTESNKSGKAPIPPAINDKLIKSGGTIIEIGRRLREMRFVPDPTKTEDEPLFSNPELQAEFWTPVMRERIFPEGFIAGPWSATQQMLDETTALYLEMVEKKKLAGELTPDRDLLQDALDTGGQLVSIAGSALGGFKGEQLEMAKNILETGGEVLISLADVRGKLKNSEFADAASVALDIASSITGAALKAAKVDDSLIKVATGAIGAGSAAVLLGKTLNQVRSGEADLSQALVQMGDVIGKAMTAAADGTGGDTAKGLKIAAQAVPTIFKAVGLGTDLPKLVRDGDIKGVIDRLGAITKEVLAQLPGLQNIGVDPAKIVDVGTAGLNLAVKTAFAVRKGEYLKALTGAINDIGETLGDVLEVAGVDDTLASQIVKLYKGGASAPTALELIRQDPPKVGEAIKALAGGVESALGGTGNETLAKLGNSLALGINSLVTVEQVHKLYVAGQYDDAVSQFADNLSEGFAKLSEALGVKVEEDDNKDDGDKDGEGGDSEKPKLKREKPVPDGTVVADLKKMLTKIEEDKQKGNGKAEIDPEKLAEAEKALKEKKDKEQADADMEDALAMLEESQLDLKALTDAEKTGAEASNIEQMIGELLRDRMVLQLATQIAQGGAEFLAQFLPGLGAVSAGIKLAASLYAAGQRAKQLDQWIKSQRDLTNAQSALSSSAANFVRNQGQQLAHYSAQAFFAAAQLAGEITKLAGPASGVGAIISAAAAASAKAEDLLMDLKDKMDIEAGWKATQKALRNPGNRRLGLEARQLNPTLAKYSLAWGAVVLKDPLARGAMKACGLSEASLNDPAADTHLVVKYMETFYEDDVSIYREDAEDIPKWVPTEIEVTIVCWAEFRRGAQGAKLTLTEASSVEGLLGEFDGVQLAAETTANELQVQQRALAAIATALRMATEAIITAKGNDSTPLPLMPDTSALIRAIDAHTVSLRVRSETANRLYAALNKSKAEAADPRKAQESLKAAEAALVRFRAKTKRVSEAAALDASGLESAKLEMQGTVAELGRKVDTAKKTREGQDPLDEAPTGRKRSNADAPKPERQTN